MQIEIDSNSGFCQGVAKTIKLAEESLNEGRVVYCLGEIVHNQEEVERLRAKGLRVIEHHELDKVKGAKVLLRTHGEPPSTYKRLTENSNSIAEGTCPVVLSLQKKVGIAFAEMNNCNGQVVIFGKKGHAEVVSLAGQTNETAIIISKPEDIDKIDFLRPIALFSQTTQPMQDYKELVAIVKQRMTQVYPAKELPLKVTDSICRQVSKRGEYLTGFAKRHDVIVFVSGANSSNGKVLYHVCRTANPKSYLVTHIKEIKTEWFAEASTVGVCGATSTPRWLMEEVAEKIKSI